ncbi:MAG: helix-turn-helix domain-containing protein [Gammaproteobacteria bacterium]|jgi:predicted DNA-binding mobile mystery protein A
MSDDEIKNAQLAGIEQLRLQPGLKQDWIRSVRTQRNMQGKELAKKMKVSPARISVLEKDEQRGAVTLKMMQKAAAALDCNFVYALVPRHQRQAAKPRIRLDASYMNGDKHAQADDVDRALQQHKLLRTIRD